MQPLKTLNQVLLEAFGKHTLDNTAIPKVITQNLNPKFAIRPYQTQALQYAINYFDPQGFDGKPKQNHQLLFHMATGSGKTLMMAGLILHLYTQGYRNFLFFVNSNKRPLHNPHS